MLINFDLLKFKLFITMHSFYIQLASEDISYQRNFGIRFYISPWKSSTVTESEHKNDNEQLESLEKFLAKCFLP